MEINYYDEINQALLQAGVAVQHIDERTFPGERWLVAYVSADKFLLAQSLVGEAERHLNTLSHDNEPPISLMFRPYKEDIAVETTAERRGRLADVKIDQLIRLLEARSRTSDALPSLKYVEDPRASLAAVAASRHQLIYGRRGVGKTALLLEAKRIAESEGDITVWVNAQPFRHLDAPTAYLRLADNIFSTLLKHGGSSQSEAFSRIRTESNKIVALLEGASASGGAVDDILPALNTALRAVLRPGLMRLNVYIDDFYYFPRASQPSFLDYAASTLRDCDGWLKIASIERLTRTFEPSSRIGLEIPHDASKIDLDRTLEDPGAAQGFLDQMLNSYTTTVGVGTPSNIAKRRALGLLVLASGGVPRDYLNLLASSIVQARKSRTNAQEVGREDVMRSAGDAALSKKRDFEQDVPTDTASSLLTALDILSNNVKESGFSYFKIDMMEKSETGYELLAQLVDLRFVHLIQATLSDQHKGGTKYEVYTLDLSEYSDVRIKRGLNVLELENGYWYWRETGKVGKERKLTGSQVRDIFRGAPLISVRDLLGDLVAE
jgi:hypothetical protein